MKKIYTLCLSVMATIGAQAQNGLTIPTKLPESIVLGMSTDGAYLCGTDALERSFVYDVKADSVSWYEPVDDMGAELRHVSRSGMAVGFNGPAITQSIDALTITNLRPGLAGSLFNDVTPDGTVAVGFMWNENYEDTPVYFKGGKFYDLPIPTEEELGFGTQGVRCISVSDDASVILGQVTDDYGTMPMILWKRAADGSYTAELTCKDYFEAEDGSKPYWMFTPMDISSNGKWVALALIKNGDYENQCLGRYNVETGELEYVDATGINGDDMPAMCQPSSIANDGTMIGITGNGMFIPRQGFYSKPGEPITLLSKLYDAVPQFAAWDELGFHTPMNISDDGKYISGFAFNEEYIYEPYIFNVADYVSTGVAPTEIAKDNSNVKKIYTPDGKMVEKMQRGMNIFKMANGRTRKMMNK